jgi:hypothetical protein
LICNGRIFNASGLRVFDASRDREKKGPERANGPSTGPSGQQAKSASFRRNPRISAGPRNEKGKPRVVDLIYLVEGSGIESESASIWFGQG